MTGVKDSFKSHIYNADYHAVDPGYVLTRPRDNAAVVQQVFGVQKMNLRVLDYGGGNDVLCSELRAAGFPVATTYDPFAPEYAKAPEGNFNLITCFETLEHMPDPARQRRRASSNCAAEPGVILLLDRSTQPADFEQARA